MNETLERLSRKLRFYFLVLITGLLVLGAAYLTFLYHYAYSNGESVGYVQKLSLKGWVCKTWEGEQLRTIAVQPALAEKFLFTVRDEAVVDKINASLGEQVILVYAQHTGLPSCFGDTDHFVVDVRSTPKEKQ